MRKYLFNIYRGVYTVLVGMRITIREMRDQYRDGPVTHQYPYERSFEKKNIREIPHGYRGQLYNRIEDCIGCKKCEMICPVACISIDTRKLPKGTRLWDSMNVVHLKDRTEIIGNVEGDEKIVPNTSVTIKNTTTRFADQVLDDRQGQPEQNGETQTIPSEQVLSVVERKPVIFYLDKFDIDMSLCMYCGLCTEVCPTECLIMKDSLKGIEYSTFDRTDLIFRFAKPEMYGDTEEDEAEAAD